MNYVAGFLFNNRREVVMILKRRPAALAGSWNAVGGKIEPGEDSLTAMCREFREETGYAGGEIPWRRFVTLNGNYALNGDSKEDFRVEFFFASVPARITENLKSATDERVARLDVDDLENENVLPNVRWLVAMALSFARGERAAEFEVRELYFS